MTDLRKSLRKRLQSHVSSLPVLPQTVVRLMSLDPSSDDFFERLLEVIRPEPTFVARIVAMANSAASGSLEPITSIRSALSRIGSRGARDLILALSVTRVFIPRDDWEKSLWRHSIHVAIAARVFAARAPAFGVSSEEAYTCGLLHDIGRFVLFQEGPEELREIDERAWDSPEALIALEMSICGLTHGELGALACKHWMLPREIREVVRDHHAPMPERLDSPVARITALIQAADLAMFPTAMPGTRGFESASDTELEALTENHLSPWLRLETSELRATLASIADEASRATEALGLSG